AARAALRVPASLPRPPLEGAAPSPLAPLVPLVAMGTLWKWTATFAALAAVGFFTVRALQPGARSAPPAQPPSEPPASSALAAVAEEDAVRLQSAEREAV